MFAEGNSASIGGSAFKGCTSLQEIFIPERAVPQQGGSSNNSNAFEGCAGDGKIYYYDEGGKDVAEWFKDFFDGLSSWTVEEA
jgi:hypothetical protein